MSQVIFSTTSIAGSPSPSVWRGCGNTLLNDLGTGRFVDVKFNGDVNTLPGCREDGDAATYAYSAAFDRAMRITTGGTDNNAAAIATEPLGTIVRHSGRNVFFEAEVSLPALGDAALFVGLGEQAAAVRDVVADNPSNSAQAGVIDESLVGFVSVQSGSAVATLDAVWQKGGDGGATDVKTSVASLTAGTSVKLGIRFDGRDRLTFYVDGASAAILTLPDGFPTAVEFAPIIGIKTGAAAAQNLDVRLFRAAVESVKTG